MKSNDLVKLLLAVVFAATFIGVVIWLVRSEGERTREALREASKQAGGEVREGIKDGVTQAVDQVATMPGEVLRDLKGVIVGDDKAGKGGPADAAGGQQSSGTQPKGAAEQQDRPSALDKAAELPGAVLQDAKDIILGDSRQRPVNSPPANKPSAKPDAVKPASTKPAEVPAAPVKSETPKSVSTKPDSPPAGDDKNPKPDMAARTDEPSAKRTDPDRVNPMDLIGDLVKTGQDITKTFDEAGQEVLGLSAEEERQLGAEVHKMVVQNLKIVNSPLLVQRVRKLAKPLLELCDQNDGTLNVAILAGDEVNAFTHLGGYVYFHKGMFDFVQSDAELQFVLAHEIAHLELKHCLKKMTYAARASQVGGQVGSSLASMAYQAIANGYSEDDEFAADAWAYRAMLRVGASQKEALSFFHHFIEWTERKKLEPERPDPKNVYEKTALEIINHFRTHPPSAQRLKRLELMEIEPNETAAGAAPAESPDAKQSPADPDTRGSQRR